MENDHTYSRLSKGASQKKTLKKEKNEVGKKGKFLHNPENDKDALHEVSPLEGIRKGTSNGRKRALPNEDKRGKKTATIAARILSSSFFKEHSEVIVQRASERMSSVHIEYLSNSFKACVMNIIENPKKVSVPEDWYKFLEIFEKNKVTTKASFTESVAQLMVVENFTEVMEASFTNIDEFLALNEFEKYQITNCFIRRFLEEGLLKRVEIENVAAKKSAKDVIKPYQLLTPKQALAKEEQVVHHIGAYIAHELVLIYGNSTRSFIRNTVDLKSSHSDDHQQWTKELSRGGLIFLTSRGFDFVKKINDVAKVHYKRKNLYAKDRVKVVIKDLENNVDIKNIWPELWGDGENKIAALKSAFQIFLNCLGKGCVTKAKTDVQILKRLSLKSNSLRKEMKNQKKCKKCHGKPEEAETVIVKVPRLRKAPQGFLSG